ncbi:hypothetical protein ACFLTE_02135 [Bacteroidota bacterium]
MILRISFNCKRYKRIIVFALLNSFIPFLFSQVHVRIEADFSMKESFIDGTQKLTMGKVYYDKSYKRIVYDISFPNEQVIVISDSLIYRITDNKLVSTTKSNNILQMSIFNLVLNGDLPYYGLKNTPYQIIDIEDNDNNVITTWKLPSTYNQNSGKMALSQIDKKLNGLITYNSEEKIVSKQFFEEYVNVSGVDFPTKIVQFIYKDNNEEIKLTNYSNIVINNLKSEKFYNYIIPSH